MGISLTTPKLIKTGRMVSEVRQATEFKINTLLLDVREKKISIEYELLDGDSLIEKKVIDLPQDFIDSNEKFLKDLLLAVYGFLTNDFKGPVTVEEVSVKAKAVKDVDQ